MFELVTIIAQSGAYERYGVEQDQRNKGNRVVMVGETHLEEHRIDVMRLFGERGVCGKLP